MNAKLLEAMQRRRDLYAGAIMKRPDSLPDLLPYDEFYEKDKIFILKDGSFGIFYRLELSQHEPLTEKEIIRKIRQMRSLLSLPSHTVLQLIYDQSLLSDKDRELEAKLGEYPDGHPVSKNLFTHKATQIKEYCKPGSEVKVFKRSLYLSIRFFPGSKKQKLIKSFFEHSGATIEDLVRELKGYIYELTGIAKGLEHGLGDKLKRLGAAELLDYLRRFFNPKTYYKREFAAYNPSVSLGKQYLYNSPSLSYEGITREGIATRTLSLVTAPQISYPGGMAYFTRLNFPFRIALNFSFPTKAKVKQFFDLKEFFLENTPTAKARVQKEEILAVQDRLARDDSCLNMTFNVIVDGNAKEEIDSRVRSVCKVFNEDLDAEAILEDHIGLASCINSLPLCYSPESDLSSRRAIRILKSDALNFLPIFDSSGGVKDALGYYLSREGNFAPFSLLNNPINSHTAILADSGSGKSALVIDIITSAKRMKDEPLVFIIDKKSSYSSLAKYYGGDLTIFDRNEKIPFSPFRGNYDEEKIAFLTKLMMSAIALTSPSFNVESEHQTVITKALKGAYKKKCDRLGLTYKDGKFEKKETSQTAELTMEEFIAELASLNDGSPSVKEAIEPVLAKLKPFYGEGNYAKFFGASNSDREKGALLYIYDLDALDSDPILQTLMTMAVIEEIRRIISLTENKGRTGFIILEEFAMLGRNNSVFRDFALDFAETMRKRGVWLITLTPRPQNYFDLITGQAFWSVAENFIFLAMNEDNIEYVRKKSSVLTDATAGIAASLTTEEGSHADFMLINKKKTIQQVYRFRRTDYDKWMSPTNAQDQ